MALEADHKSSKLTQAALFLSCAALLGLFCAVLVGTHRDRVALAAAEQSTKGRLGGHWSDFEDAHGLYEDGRFNGLECKRTDRLHHVWVERDRVKMVGMDFSEPFGRDQGGASLTSVESLLDDYLPADAVFVGEKYWTHKVRDGRGTVIRVFEAGSLGHLHPLTTWGAQEPGTIQVWLRVHSRQRQGELFQAVVQFQRLDGRFPYPWTKDPLPSSWSEFLPQESRFCWPWDMPCGRDVPR